MIDPEYFLDEDIAKLSPHARLLYIGSWGIADDNVYTFPYRPEWIKAQIFPYERVNIHKLINELVKAKKYVIFTSDDKEYIYIKNMGKWQRIERPSKQKYPAFSEDTQRILGDGSVNTHSEVKLSKDKLSEDKEECLSFLSYYNEKTKKHFRPTQANITLIASRLKEGFTIEQLKGAVDNFVKDDWAERSKFMDLVYCIGKQRGKPDNLERWMNWKPTNKGRLIA